jgi:ABC-2 type transport system ATP-binding protein
MQQRIALAVGAALSAATLAVVPTAQAQAVQKAAPAQAPAVKVTHACLASVPDPGTTEKVKICYSIFRPGTASRVRRAPLIMHSHGWGGSRAKDPAAFGRFLRAGYGVLSFDQRGFGASGGHAYVENPTVEGHDVRRLVRLVSRLRWVKQDAKGDPRMGAIGGSYGGGYQFLAAFEELRTKGKPVLDALAPEITWYDLNQSLAPERVVRTEWAAVLAAASLPSDALPPNVYAALVEGAATGFWPDGSVPGTQNISPFFAKNGPRWHVSRGRRLDIPVLLGQGTTDSLFPLQQGLANWRHALTRKARRNSIFVGYNGGHVLPAVFPRGVNVTSDPCSRKLAGGNFERLSLRFFNEQLRNRDTGLRGYGRLHLDDGPHGGAGHGVPHRRQGGHDPGRRGRGALQDRRGTDPDRRVVVPHRHADREGRQQPGLLRPGGRYLRGRRAPHPEQRAAVQRARPGVPRGEAPDRPSRGGDRRARGTVAVPPRQPGQ